jgi:hypothetical protein
MRQLADHPYVLVLLVLLTGKLPEQFALVQASAAFCAAVLDL